MTAMTPEQAREANRNIRFLPADQSPDPEATDALPAMELPDGKQVYAYYDDKGVLTVSVDLEGGDPVSLRVNVMNAVVHEDILGLPDWGDLSELDKGIALVHAGKALHEGAEYAAEFYAPQYEHPLLADLTAETRSEHARETVGEVFGDTTGAEQELGSEEYERLRGLAYKSGRA